MRFSNNSAVFALQLFTIMFLSFAGFSQTTYTWNGGAGNWNIASNWSPNGVPGVNDNAIIHNGTVLLTNDATVTGFTLNGGTLYGAGKLSISGTLTWTSGDMAGDTTLAGSDTTEVLHGAAMVLSGANSKDLRNRVLINGGTASWIDAGSFELKNNSKFVNKAGAIFNIQTDAFMNTTDPNTIGFENAGTVTKDAGSGIATIDVFFSNTGSFNISAGTLRFDKGGNSTGGTFSATSGNTINFLQGVFTFDNVTIDGSGTIQITGDSVAVTGSGLTVNSTATLELANGSLGGGNGPITVNGTLNWNKGSIHGPATVTVNGTVIFTGTSADIIDNTTLTINGSALFTGTGDIRLTKNAVLNNTSSATFQIQTDALIDYSPPGGGTFTNSGTITKSGGAGTTTIDVYFVNSGILNVNSGTIFLDRGSNTNGAVNLASGGTLMVGDENHVFSTTASINGEGNMNFDGTSGNTNFNGSYGANGTIGVSKGILNFNGIYNGNGTISITNGTLNLNTNITLLQLNQSGGLLVGPGSVVISHAFNWSGGTIRNSSSLTSDSSMTIEGSALKILDGGIVQNNGAATVIGGGDIDLKNNAQLVNQAGGTIDFQSDMLIDFASPDGGTFTNAGTIMKSAGVGDLLIDVAFTNSGTTNISSGSLKLIRSSNGNGGSFNVASGLLQFSIGTHTVNGVIFDGSGIVEIATSTANLKVTGTGNTFNSGVSFELNGGLLDGDGDLTVNGPFGWSNGTIGGSGAFAFNGPIYISGNTSKLLDSQTLSNSGSLVWDGLADIRLRNGAVLENRAGATFDIQTDGQIDFMAPGGGTFTNAGTVTKSMLSGNTIIDVEVNNSGTININSGSIELKRNTTTTGDIHLASGAMLMLNGDSHNFDGANVSGSGKLELTGSGMVNVTGAGLTIDTLATFEMINGMYNNNAPTALNGLFNWNTGTLKGTSPFTVNGTMELLGAAEKRLDGVTLNNSNLVNVLGPGNIKLSNNALIRNQTEATFDFQSDLFLEFIFPGGGSFTNAGTVIKSNAGGSNTFNIDFQNDGILAVHVGRMIFNKTLNNNTAGIIQGTDTLGVSSATFSNNGNVKPGASPGVLTIMGDYPQAATAVLQIELGGHNVGSEYDRLNVQGTAQLAGTLEIQLLNSFQPAIGDTFKIMSYDSRIGQFTTLNMPTVGGQPIFGLDYQSDALVITTLLGNQAPVAADDSLNINEDDSLSINVLTNDLDPDGDDITLTGFTQALNGAVSQTGDSTLSYQPAENFFGADTFYYTISDISGATDSAIVAINVQPVNDPPLLNNFPANLTLSEDDTLSLGLDTLVIDLDDPLQNLSWTMEFLGGTVVSDSIQVIFNTGTNVVTFIPNPNYNILDQELRVSVCDTSNACDQDTVIFSVSAVNDPPVISELPVISFSTDSSASLNVWEYVHDVETADSQLTYAFSVSNDSLLYTYTDTTGILELFAVSGFSGNVTLTIQVNDPENAAVSSELSVTVNPVVGIAEITGAGIPQEFALRQNYPNPFNPNTTIKFQLPHTEDVKLAVYNILGQKVRILLNEKMNAGYYQVSWDGLSEHGRQMASGVYIYRLEAGSFVEVKKMTLMK
jgi:hypothetical protein